MMVLMMVTMLLLWMVSALHPRLAVAAAGCARSSGGVALSVATCAPRSHQRRPADCREDCRRTARTAQADTAAAAASRQTALRVAPAE
jgi:hypothetical protein